MLEATAGTHNSSNRLQTPAHCTQQQQQQQLETAAVPVTACACVRTQEPARQWQPGQHHGCRLLPAMVLLLLSCVGHNNKQPTGNFLRLLWLCWGKGDGHFREFFASQTLLESF